jgi:hypothetical protein
MSYERYLRDVIFSEDSNSQIPVYKPKDAYIHMYKHRTWSRSLFGADSNSQILVYTPTDKSIFLHSYRNMCICLHTYRNMSNALLYRYMSISYTPTCICPFVHTPTDICALAYTPTVFVHWLTHHRNMTISYTRTGICPYPTHLPI